jgi:hypothetical protein
MSNSEQRSVLSPAFFTKGTFLRRQKRPEGLPEEILRLRFRPQKKSGDSE